MREDRLADHLPDELPSNPMHWAESWLQAATDDRVQRNPNAMTLATVGDDRKPSARVVLCKSFVADRGYVVLYTNYESRKCAELADNPNVSLVFHWDSMGRQIRIEGVAVKSPAAESDAYFATRDLGSQLGAWGSDQSRTLASRAALRRQLAERGADLERARQSVNGVHRPPHWGGIRIWATAIELWIEGKDRVHDRARWTRELSPASDESPDDAFAATAWTGTRLQP